MTKPPLPLGYRFKPTDKELVTSFLRKKATGQAMPKNSSNDILDLDLYGDQKKPWEIFDKENHPGDEFYVFTKIRKKFSGGGKVMDRHVRDGTWKADNFDEVFDDDATTILGFKRSLHFFDPFVVQEKEKEKEKDDDKKKAKMGRTKWIMHEYTLNDGGESSNSSSCMEIPAICRIKRGKTPNKDTTTTTTTSAYSASALSTDHGATTSCHPCCSSSSTAKKRPLDSVDDHHHRNSKRCKETSSYINDGPSPSTSSQFQEQVVSSSVGCTSNSNLLPDHYSQPSCDDQSHLEASLEWDMDDLMEIMNFDMFEDVDFSCFD